MNLRGWVGWLWLAGTLVASAEEGNEVPAGHLEAYFAEKPQSFLADPQELLTPAERRERERFLEHHAADSEVDFHVLLFGKGQVIPEGVRTEELAERYFEGGRPALLALYFLGEPERVRIQPSRQIAEGVGPVEMDRLRDQAVRAAASRVVPAEQLEDFCVQLAIGIFWIERKMSLGKQPPAVMPGPISGLSTTHRGENESQVRMWLAAWWAEWGLVASVILGTVLAASMARWLFWRRARHRFPGNLPEPRLGGSRGAAVGALIEFRSARTSPSQQKGGPDDSLGGL